MKKLICIAVLALAPLATTVAAEPVGSNPGGTCIPMGTWWGQDTVPGVGLFTTYLVSYFDGTAQGGAFVIDLPAFDPTLGMKEGPLAAAVKYSAARGNWYKVSPGESRWVALMVVADANNIPLAVYKIFGPTTANKDCTELVVDTWVEIYAPNANPFEDDPIAPKQFVSQTYMHRMPR